jgi:sodium/bile acid cotransporter 3/5
MPAWIFSLGRVIFEKANLRIPYSNILCMILGLLIPVSIGVLIRRRCPRLAEALIKLTRPFSLLLIIYIFTFGIYANVYVFYLITWNVSTSITLTHQRYIINHRL